MLVNNRFKAIEEEKKKQEELKQLQQYNFDMSKGTDKHIEQVILVKPTTENEDKILTLRFTVRATRAKLQELKKFLKDGGYDYE